MKRNPPRPYRDSKDDPLWSAVWQIWPTAMTFEESTPFDAQLGRQAAAFFRQRRQAKRAQA